MNQLELGVKTIEANLIRTDLTRVIAIGMVIIHHIYSYYIVYVNTLIKYNLLISSFNYFGQIGVALLFICSGANLKEKVNLKEKFLKMYPAYIICLLMWEFIQPLTPGVFIEYAFLLNGFFGVVSTPLWFIPALFGLYILYPILQKLVKHKKLTVIVIGLSFCGILPAVILTYKLPLPTTYPYYSTVLIALCPFIFGMLTKKVERRYIILIPLFAIFWLLSIWQGTSTNWQVFSPALVPFIAYGVFSLTANTVKTVWANTTLILYLIHPFVIFWLAIPYLYGWSIIPLSIPLLLIASWYLTKLNEKFSKYLIEKFTFVGNKN